MARALITGITGFAGSHLADQLAIDQGWDVWGIGLPSDSLRNVAHLGDRVHIELADLSDIQVCHRLLKAAQPTHIFHLAAQASVARSWSEPAVTLVNNITAEANLFSALTASSLRPRVLVVGSADEYGLVDPDQIPISEDTPLRPINPYAVSKITQDFLGLQYYLSHQIPVIRVRPFNHIGPRQAPGFAIPDFSRQIARIEMGQQEPIIQVGNLQSCRAFSDVRDIVVAYRLALCEGAPGEAYNIGSDQPVRIADVLGMLLAKSSAQIRVEQRPDRMRPSDIPILSCDSSKLERDTGWKPRYTLDTSLQDVLDYWRTSVAD